MKATIYRTNGTSEIIELPEERRLDFLQKIVGGLIEFVEIQKTDDEEKPIGISKDLIINEEGLLMDLPPNPWSYAIGFNSIWRGQSFRGDVILVEGNLP